MSNIYDEALHDLKEMETYSWEDIHDCGGEVPCRDNLIKFIERAKKVEELLELKNQYIDLISNEKAKGHDILDVWNKIHEKEEELK